MAMCRIPAALIGPVGADLVDTAAICRRFTTVARLFFVLLCMSTASAQQLRLYQQEPYDILVVRDNGGQTAHRVVPIDRELLRRMNSEGNVGELPIRLTESPEVAYVVAIRDVVRVTTFEERLMRHAERFLRQRDFDHAYDYIDLLDRSYGEVEGVADLVARFLTEEAHAAYVMHDFELAWLRLDTLLRRQPDDDGVRRALAKTLHQLVLTDWNRSDYRQINEWLRVIDVRYGEQMESLRRHWDSQIDRRTTEQLARLQQQLDDQAFAPARETAHALRGLNPNRDDVRETLEQMDSVYPSIVVAVRQHPAPSQLALAAEWSIERIDQLATPRLLQFHALGSEGAASRSAWGVPAWNREQHTWSFRPEDRVTNNLSAGRIAEAVLDAVERGSAPRLERELVSVGVSEGNVVELRLRRSPLGLNGFLRIPLVDGAGSPLVTGVYTAIEENDAVGSLDEQRYLLYHRGMVNDPIRYQEIVEQSIVSTSDQGDALTDGSIGLIERGHPADIATWQARNGVRVVPYAIPSIHILVPNIASPVWRNRTLRRGLLMLLDRDAILHDVLLAGREVAGCVVLSAPLIAGSGPNDPLAYGYDETVPPRKHAFATGRVLAEAGWREDQRARAEASPQGGRAPLRLLHFGGEIAAPACNAMARSWMTAGIDVELIDGGRLTSTELADAEWDLRYAEIMMVEPLVDVVRWLAAPRIPVSPYLELALRNLEDVTTWSEARERLREVHRLCHEELPVLPLWQLSEYAVVPTGNRNITAPLLSLYQDVRTWRADDSPVKGGAR